MTRIDISRAYIKDDHLVILTNNQEVYELNFNTNSLLKQISTLNRNKFTLENNTLHWYIEDIHIDTDYILYNLNQEFKEELDRSTELFYRKFT
jgi:hypothetical protein